MTLNYCLVFLLKCVVVLGVLTDTCTKLDHQRSHLNIYDSLPLGHPGRCLYQLTGSLSGNLYRLEDLPGVGWDNLQNKNMGNVVHHEYRQCKTTSDGKLLIPDGVTVTAIKDSEFQTVAEVFQHWDEYTSTSSSSINAEADIGFDCFGIGGKYSQEYEQTKTEQFSTKSTMTRMQIRLVRYRAQIDTGSRLGHEFRSRLRKIAAHNIQNRTRLATYESQLLVRDFGSHVVNSVILGAALVKTDLMQDDGTYQGTQESKQRMAEVAAHGFFEIFNFGASGQYTTSSSTSDNSGTNFKTLSSRISSIGGKVLRLKNFSAEDWINSVDDNLVVLDRSGEPLHYFVNYNTLRDLPDFIVQKVHTVVKQAVLQYYKQNTYKGCTKFDRPNFSFQANVDDGSCKPLKRKFHFGGVFQECNSQGYANLCLDITVKNPVTGDFSCPANYEKILLNRGSKSRTDAVQQMYQCGHWWHHKQCVKTVYMQSYADYVAYWCAKRNGDDDEQSEMLFGGLFTPSLPNILTRTNACPKQFVALTVLDDLSICVSNDFELDSQYSLPFAGFHSCLSGNPLALSPNSTLNVTAPSDCPIGYSQHLAVVDDGCEINFCIKSGIMANLSLPTIKKPPFISMPLDQHIESKDNESSVYVVSSNGSEWSTLEDQLEAEKVKSAKMVQQSAITLHLYNSNQSDIEISQNSNNSEWFVVGNEINEENIKPAANISLLKITTSSPESSNQKQMKLATLVQSENSVRTPNLKSTSGASSQNTGENTENGRGLSDGMIVMFTITGTLLCVLIILLIAILIRRRQAPYQRI